MELNQFIYIQGEGGGEEGGPGVGLQKEGGAGADGAPQEARGRN